MVDFNKHVKPNIYLGKSEISTLMYSLNTRRDFITGDRSPYKGQIGEMACKAMELADIADIKSKLIGLGNALGLEFPDW